MNIKNRNGVTITVLVITIIIMLILFGITFSTSVELLENSQKNKMKTMLYMVQSRAEILLDDYLFENDNNPDNVDNSSALNAVSDDIIKSKLAGVYLTNGDIDKIKRVGYETSSATVPAKSEKIYCSWDEATLKSQGIDTKNLAQGDTIIIQYDIAIEKVDVASTKGYSDNNVAIHSLKDF